MVNNLKQSLIQHMNLRKTIFFPIVFIVFTQCNSNVEKNLESTFSSFDKIKIAYTEEGNGDAIMLIHGFIMDGSSWNKTELKSQLLNSGNRVIVPDLRGNGSSDKPQGGKGRRSFPTTNHTPNELPEELL